MFKRYVASKRHTMQIDFDDYLVALAKERKAGAERARAQRQPAAAAAPGRAGRGVSGAALAGRRERTKAANRAAILSAGREVFAELGYGAASVRHIVRRTDLAAGTFYNYFPDKEAVFRDLVREVAQEARRRVRAARRAAHTPREFVEDAYRAYFGFIVEDAGRAAFLSRNAGAIRAMFEESEGPAGHRRAGRGPARRDRPRRDAGGRRRLLRGGDGRGRARARPAARGARPARRRRRDALRHAAVPGRDRCGPERRPARRPARARGAGDAPAALRIGIAENTPNLFSDPLFQALGAKYARVVVSYNVMTSGDDELQRITDYVNAAAAAGVEPLVTFEHARGAAEICNKRKNRRKRAVPAADAEAVRAQLQGVPRPLPAREDVRRPGTRSTTTRSRRSAIRRRPRASPTSRAATAAAARSSWRTCSTAADSARAKKPRYRSALRYIKRFKRALKAPRTICGLHNYGDTNRFRDSGTKAIIKALRCKEIWLTETGGIYKFRAGKFKASAKRQLRATKYMFKLAKRNPRIKRLYVYTWFGATTPRFDAGLVAHGRPRPAYGEVKKRLR